MANNFSTGVFAKTLTESWVPGVQQHAAARSAGSDLLICTMLLRNGKNMPLFASTHCCRRSRYLQRDRYQVYQEHPPGHFIVEDTGLGISVYNQVLVVTVISRPRTQEAEEAFYAELCRDLKASCGIEASDVMVSIVTNTDADWSFGNGLCAVFDWGHPEAGYLEV